MLKRNLYQITRKQSTALQSTKTNINFVAKLARPIYFDYQATTPMDPRVTDAMLPYMTHHYGNPHSRTHQFGWDAEKAIEQAREHVASLIGGTAKEIVFTSGATESNNLAIKGEHKCVLDACRYLQEHGREATYMKVGKDGLINLEELEQILKSKHEDTCLVSIMTVNNEIGVIQPIKEISDLCKKYNVFFHTDAAQAVGKIPVDVNALNVDLMSISGHKIYGPKGVGALYVRRRPRIRLEPLINGGGQERGLRSGTLPTFLAVGLGEACRIAKLEMQEDHQYIEKLSNYFVERVMKDIPFVTRNGQITKDCNTIYPGCVNLSFAYVEGESLLMALKQFALSSGSACTSASLEPSYVLRALGTTEDMAHSSIRFGIGRFSSKKDVDSLVEVLKVQVQRLRDMSPLYELVLEGVDLSTIEWSQH